MKITLQFDFLVINQFCIEKKKDSTSNFCTKIDADKIQFTEYFALIPFSTNPFTAYFPRSGQNNIM